MTDSGSSGWAGVLFVATVLAALTLLAAAIGGPWILRWSSEPSPLLLLFGADLTVRRTAFASALGLLVTAFIFFRPAALTRRRKGPKEPPVDMTGA
jgi:hypothetical protein